MGKLLVICGPTSVGKTSLALSLAKKFNGEILSADSRQVYRGMDIGTGKDLPSGAKPKIPWFKNFGYYEVNGVKIWGYDLADPGEGFSVAQYVRFSEKIMADITKRKKLPIVVGGTGLYIKAITDGIPTVFVPRNERLRKNFSKKPQVELFEILAQLDSIKAGSMNTSDRRNPRRLIRAIEVATWELKHKGPSPEDKKKKIRNTLFIGLMAPREVLFERISARVEERVKAGIKKEINNLLKKGLSWKDQAMTSIGYRQWSEYFSGEKTEEEIKTKWTDEEKKYAKRQMAWFKREKRIVWFDTSTKNYRRKLEKVVEKWYIRP
ncbi:tRNA (adenosine(37)-N6)-dimethylallyltransferase MiaA [Candidatus Woesebacteria bacterium]|nr:tRNA (adenosine(37)-N6)-dimethylallyltransferase MiaA [Candidatus Woesebacteria bacterium]